MCTRTWINLIHAVKMLQLHIVFALLSPTPLLLRHTARHTRTQWMAKSSQCSWHLVPLSAHTFITQSWAWQNPLPHRPWTTHTHKHTRTFTIYYTCADTGGRTRRHQRYHQAVKLPTGQVPAHKHTLCSGSGSFTCTNAIFVRTQHNVINVGTKTSCTAHTFTLC